MKRAVSGSGVITVRVVAAAITLDDQGIRHHLYPKGAPGSPRDDQLPCFPALNSDVVSIHKVPFTVCHPPSVESTAEVQYILECS